MSILTDGQREELTSGLLGREALALGSMCVALGPLSRTERLKPSWGDDSQTIERKAECLANYLDAIERSNGSQNMSRVGTLVTAGDDKATLAAAGDEVVEEMVSSLPAAWRISPYEPPSEIYAALSGAQTRGALSDSAPLLFWTPRAPGEVYKPTTWIRARSSGGE